MSRDAQSVRKWVAQSVRKWVAQKRAQKESRKRANAGGRGLHHVSAFLFLLLLSLSSLSLSSLSHTLSFLELRRLAEHAQSGLAGSPQAHAHCQLGVELHAPRPLVVKPAQHDARTMVVLVVGIRYTGSDHWPIPSATTWSYGPVHRVHDARHQMAIVATRTCLCCQLANGRIGGCFRRASHR